MQTTDLCNRHMSIMWSQSIYMFTKVATYNCQLQAPCPSAAFTDLFRAFLGLLEPCRRIESGDARQPGQYSHHQHTK